MTFKKISAGLAVAIETKLDMTISSVLAHETALWAKDHALETAPAEASQLNDALDHPQLVSKVSV